MDKIFETAIFNRKTLVKMIGDLSYNQLIKIPENFNNSIFWNIAHILVTQQLLVYKLSGLPMLVKEELIEKYTKGSKATDKVSKEEIQYVKENLIPFAEKVEEDYRNHVFKNYYPYKTSVDIELKSVDDSLKFMAFHDGIHLGIILSLIKVV